MNELYYLYAIIALSVVTLAAVIVCMISVNRTSRRLLRLKKATEKSISDLAAGQTSLADDIEETRRDLSDSRAQLAEVINSGLSAVSASISDSSARSEARLEAVRSSVQTQLSQLREENGRQLDRMRMTVDEKLQQSLDDRLSKSFASVKDSLEQVYRGLGEMQGLAQGVGDLRKVLSNVKTRGMLGEIQLRSILEQILSSAQYAENVAIDPSSSERVEFAVRLPGDEAREVLLPIDAKFPGDTYEKLVQAQESGDPAAAAECRRALAAVIKKEAKDVHDKYICPPYSTEFAVLFLPFEGLYAEVVSMGLMEFLQREFQVMVAGPSTMAALLNSLQMGFKALAIRRNAGKVWAVLGDVKNEFDKFGEVLSATQTRLDQANRELDKLVGTRTRMIQRSLREVQTLNADFRQGQEGELPEIPE